MSSSNNNHLTSTVDGLMLSSTQETNACRDYWNLDDILAEDEHVPCTFKYAARGLGYLDHLDTNLATTGAANSHKKGQLDETLAANSRVDIPLWLAVALAQRELVELRNPKFMSKNYYNTLKAGSDVVSLRLMSPYVYENAIKMAENMTEDKAEEAMKIYQQVFIERFTKLIIEHSNNANQTEQFSGVTKKFTNLEKEIFDLHKKQKLRFQTWKNREGPSIEVNQEFLNKGEQGGPGNENNLKRFKTH